MEFGARRGNEAAAQGRFLNDLFDALPTGILVVSANHQIVTWNPALELLLGRDTLEQASTCCELLACTDPCIGDLAVARASQPREYVVRAPGGNHNVAVTPSVVGRGRGNTVLLQFRTLASASESSAVPVTMPPAQATLRIRTLGRTVVETADGELNGGWLDRRAGHLLKYLVAHRHAAVPADAIADALWPGARSDPTNTVRHFVHELREKLEPNRGRYGRSAFVIARHGGYQLDAERVTIDTDEFESSAKAGLAALASGEAERGVEQLEAAMRVYRGDFLSDERYEDWAIAERERLIDLACQVLRALARAVHDARAADYLERLAEMEPLDADIQRELIATWLRQGRRTRAIRRYRMLQSRLMREFGERVTFDLPGLGSDVQG
jgi:DNA-binding SARP family transcriptional activator